MNMNKRVLMLACALALCVPIQTLHAQAQPATASLEEVIVTARKRDETSLNVPVAVNVFTAAEIQAGLASFGGELDETVVRAITGEESVAEYMALLEAAAPE